MLHRCVALMFGVFGLSSGGVNSDMFAQQSIKTLGWESLSHTLEATFSVFDMQWADGHQHAHSGAKPVAVLSKTDLR